VIGMRDAKNLAVPLGFAGNPLDRLSQLRDNAAALADIEGERARAVVFVQAMPVLQVDGPIISAFLPLVEARKLGEAQIEVLLGRDAEGPVFALLLPDAAAGTPAPEAGGFIDERQLSLPGRPDLSLVDLRQLANQGGVTAADLAILGQARSILHWHGEHRFCARCGAPTRVVHAGWRRDCGACGAQHFPRTEPVAIMLVVDGDDCLMGRQSRFPPKMYSCLAGFIEGGETVEEAVRREVAEEAGISVGAVDYVASQPWPFPSSLMLGCRAEALSRAITMDATELEDCRWFSRAEVRAMLAGAHEQDLVPPAPVALARTLLEHWLAED